MDSHVCETVYREDAIATHLARLTARNATGLATGRNGEGKWLKQADLSAVSCNVYDESDSDVLVTTPAVTVAGVIIDTPVTSNEIWTRDSVGYNFLHDIPSAAFPTGGHVYRTEYLMTLAGGEKLPALVFRGKALPIVGS